MKINSRLTNQFVSGKIWAGDGLFIFCQEQADWSIDFVIWLISSLLCLLWVLYTYLRRLPNPIRVCLSVIFHFFFSSAELMTWLITDKQVDVWWYVSNSEWACLVHWFYMYKESRQQSLDSWVTIVLSTQCILYSVIALVRRNWHFSNNIP